MSWKDELKPASFKGVPFRTDAASVEFGWTTTERATATADLKWKEGKEPVFEAASQSEDPAIDQGTKGARIFSIEAHFTGDDYLTNRESFIAAVEEGGPGILQLPLMKPINAFAARGTTQFSNTAGGFESVSITFIETTLKPKPDTETNQQREADNAAAEGEAASVSRFSKLFSAATDGAAALAEKLSGKLMDVIGFGGAGDRFSDFVSKAMSLSENARTIIQTPQRFAEEIFDVIGDLTYAFTNPIDALNAQFFIFETFRDGLQTTLNGSESRRRQVSNNLALALAVESACVMQTGIAAMNVEYATLGDALNVRSEFEQAVKTMRSRLGNADGYDGVYHALGSLLGSVTRFINDTANLPSALKIDFADRNPALVIAEDYYGDADRADELVRRNSVRNPLFCDREMEVLSR
jgi:prophage DNA circulation protein